jgi:hypothetical protein
MACRHPWTQRSFHPSKSSLISGGSLPECVIGRDKRFGPLEAGDTAGAFQSRFSLAGFHDHPYVSVLLATNWLQNSWLGAPLRLALFIGWDAPELNTSVTQTKCNKCSIWRKCEAAVTSRCPRIWITIDPFPVRCLPHHYMGIREAKQELSIIGKDKIIGAIGVELAST